MVFGNWQVDLLETGRFKLDGGAMFGVVPKNLWKKNNPPDELNRIDMTMRSLCLRRDDRVIIVDTGVGHKESEKFAQIFAIDFSAFSLVSGLSRLGIEAADVTDVILTHLHFDHAGGSVTRTGADLSLTFPNATHYVQRRHWEWAMNPSDRDRASFLPDNYMPLQDAGRLQLLDGDENIFDDLALDIVNGHTFGQQLVRVQGHGRSLLYTGDLVPMSAHVPGAWIMGYDLQPLLTLEEKNTLLARAASNGDILIFEHDPLVEAATVESTEKGFRLGRYGTLEQLLSSTPHDSPE
ncbi:MAG: MBL fold metallo-hydrolase [Bacteroidetes bacterium]|nr:MBL fold metallo-hydrolase [Bacteroidota bacterium]